MNAFSQDLRYVFRLLRKQPGFTAIVVVSLALGIGANTMIFSLIDGLLLRPMPFPEPDRIALLWFTPPNQPGGRAQATRANCMALRELHGVFEQLGCIRNDTMNLGEDAPGAAAPERIQGQTLTADFPRVAAVNPILGRWFSADEEKPEAVPVLLISYRLWQRRFSASSDVLGRSVRMDGVTGTIIGVMPRDFQFLNLEADFWSPFRNPANAARSPTRILLVAGRLKPGTTLTQAQSQVNGFAANLSEQVPETNKGWGLRIELLRQVMAGDTWNLLMTFQGAVAFVLLIACANVAGLLLAQGAAQHKELAVRSALGSSRWRIVRQLLSESIVLALLGGVLGLAIGWAGLRLFLSVLPPLPWIERIGLNANVLGYTMLVSLAAGIIFGILPALQASRPDLMDALRENTRSATGSRARQRLRSLFVVVQVSMALVLLIGAGLTMKSFIRLSTVQAGFNPANLMTFQIQFPSGEFLKDTGQSAPSGSSLMELSPRITIVSERIRERLSAIPGVESATVALTPPLAGGARGYTFTIEGRPAAATEQEALNAQWFPVMSRYFATVGVPVLRGREFNVRDSAAGPPVAIISSTMAQRYWPNEDPIGKRIQVTFYNDPMREVVGVVGDVRQNIRERQSSPQIYVPYAQLPVRQEGRTAFGLPSLTFVVRSALPSAQLVPALRAAVTEVDRTQAVSFFLTVQEYVERQRLGDWATVTLLSIFGGVALLLAVVGIYGVMAHAVSQRTGEIGIRIALGATSGRVLHLMLGRGLLLITIGLLIGFAASIALTRVIQQFLWEVTATDPLTFVLALLALSVVALLACYIPARRAMKIDPIIALRYE